MDKEEKKMVREAKAPIGSERMRMLVLAYISKPKATIQELSDACGLKPSSVMVYMATNKYLIALKQAAKAKATSLIPKALQSLEESLESTSQEVKFRSSVKLLESEDIMGPSKIEINATDGRSLKEMWETIRGATKIPEPTIMDVELIGD